ncbi:MAG: hypothetical protein N2595_01615 [bacterium]|nr:hypothetical protein [bacterium]
MRFCWKEDQGKGRRGVALVSVLSVLTILAVLAAVFALYTTLDQMLSRTAVARLQADLIADAALEHALSLLRLDVMEQPAWDDLTEPWCTRFKVGSGGGVDVGGAGEGDARWFYVRNEEGKIVGRYAVVVEDECGKINVNVASSVGGVGQHQGFGAFEVALTDGRGAGLPFSLELARKVVQYRYGRDGRPGQAGVDDNYNASTYANDEIDNNANRIVDEAGEGVDEPEEYTPARPKWDDRVYASVDEIVERCVPRAIGNRAARRVLRRYATVHSRSRDAFYDERIRGWRRQANVNVATREQVRRIMNRANAEARFESSARNLAILVANVLDYRDENHVLTTSRSEYGVEAVCFNEVVSYDGSWIRETDWSGWWFPTSSSAEAAENHVLCYNHYYGADKYGYGGATVRNRFRIKEVSPPEGGTITVTLEPPRTPSIRLDAFLECEAQTGGWPVNLWRDGLAWVGEMNAAYTLEQRGAQCDVVRSEAGKRQVTLRYTTDTLAILTNNAPKTICLRNRWNHTGAMWTDRPQQTEMYCFRLPERYMNKRLYYQVINANHCFKPEYGYGRSVVREMDMDGDGNRYSVTEELRSADGTYRLQYLYKDGKAVRPNTRGYIAVTLTSSEKCRPAGGVSGRYNNYSDAMYFIRPDVVELINISHRPISLRNWRVVVNTGVEANELAVIDTARYYHRGGRGRYDDPNPRIDAGGYFYLTNNREIFGIDYCDGNHTYGNNQNEIIPVFELPDQNWGIEYKITRVRGDYITVEGADWQPDQLAGELIEYVSNRRPANRDAPNGQIKRIWNNTRNTIYVGGSDAEGSGLQPGDRVRIKGLPRQGGFVSFTLKNEYNQITARTTQYGSLREEEFGYSTEKYDPTHYTWVKSSRPTIGGYPRKARNNSFPASSGYVPPHVKDNRFVSIGEIQKVRKASDWENIGMSGRGTPETRTLKAIARYFTTAGVRLDAEEAGAYVGGEWRPAFGVAAGGSLASGFRAKGVRWEPNIWAGQKLRIMSGPLAGEMFFITNSTVDGITVAGYSVPSDKRFTIEPGTAFSVGPGYSTPLYYTRQNGAQGVWEWQHKELEALTYGLYIFGLSDAIKTTEFLEENWNARIDVEIWNFARGRYDRLPRGERASAVGAGDDVYQIIRSPGGQQYDKSDSFYAGLVLPEHISAQGGIRLRLTARGLGGADASGFAWFDYAFLAPASVTGKININTAPPRVLACLPHITAELAHNIATGTDGSGQARLLPYKNITDVLDVRHMTAEIFADIANLITTRSDQFRVQIVAQAIEQPGGSGRFNAAAGDRITSEVRRDVIVDRSNLTDDDPRDLRFTIVQTR